MSTIRGEMNKYDLSGQYGIGYTNKGDSFLFDLQDFDIVKKYKWFINTCGYVEASAGTKDHILLHRLIMGTLDNDKVYVDHIRHNKTDNRKEKLRIVDPSQSAINRGKQSNNTSGVTGVYFHKPSGLWVAYIKINGKQFRRASKDRDKAIAKRKQLEEQYFGEYSYDESMKGR